MRATDYRQNNHMTTLYKDDKVYHFDSSDKGRADPILVQVVEELGNAANDRFAQLAVVEIPDGVEFEISEYDGREHVAEAHRTWR